MNLRQVTRVWPLTAFRLTQGGLFGFISSSRGRPVRLAHGERHVGQSYHQPESSGDHGVVEHSAAQECGDLCQRDGLNAEEHAEGAERAPHEVFPVAECRYSLEYPGY